MDITTLFNQLMIKENLKIAASTFTFLFGIIEFYFLCIKSKNSKIFSAAYIFSQISIFLSTIITREGIWLILAIAGFFGVTEMEFGKRILFEVNPWHPKHVLSIAALNFACLAICLKFIRPKSISNWTFFVLVFNVLTSRPVLHLSYQLSLLLF